MAGKLYICATPIGNLKDVTFRVIETLQLVDLIAAEDTRRTRKLLTHYDIKKKLVSFHDQNETTSLPKLLSFLLEGHTIAQVSDAGLPGIADPGHRLIKACIENEIPIEVLPGPSAFLTAAVLSGLPTDDIHFLGYVPRKQGARKRLLSEMEDSRSTLIFYESPRRLLTTLNDIDELFGDRQIFIGREMTKKFEEHLRGSAKQIGQILADRGVKGEVVVVIAGLRDKKISFEPQQLAAEIRHEVETGKSKKDAIKDVAEKHGLSRRLVYEAAHEKQDKTPTQ